MAADVINLAVVGHVEWVQFASVEHVPRAGEVVHAQAPFEEPAGGGGVAAVQLTRLAAAPALLLTALGQDQTGAHAQTRLEQLGVSVAAEHVATPTRRAITLLDAHAERTIITLGARLEPPAALVERELRGQWIDGLYFTAGDEGALRAARRAARVLVASPRAAHALGCGIELDALVLSGDDEHELELARPALAEADVVVYTEGTRGGRYTTRAGRQGRWLPAPLPGPAIDTYGAGDSFAAGFTFALAAGLELQSALALAARSGAMCATGRGPYERQLSAADL